MKSFTIKNKFFKHTIVFIVWIIIWQICYTVVNKDIFWVSPISVARRIFILSKCADFWKYILLSLMRVILGFVLALTAGTMLAVLMHFSEILYIAFKPIILIMRTTPVASFILLALVFIKSFYLPILISSLTVVPIVWSNIFEGISKVDIKLLQMSKVYQISKKKKIIYIYLPSLKPYFLSAATTGVGFAWKSAIAAEIISNAANSIGSQILNAKIYMETVDVFAWTVIIILMSFVLEKILVIILNKI